jgi:hypothetical protein
MPSIQDQATSNANSYRAIMDRLLGRSQQQQDRDQGQSDRYTNQADWYYEQLMNNPGLTPEERQGMLQEMQRNGLALNAGDRANNYLTQDEQGQIAGNAFGWQSGYADRYNGMEDAFGDAQGRLRGVRGTGAASMRDVNSRATGVTGDALSTMDARLQGSANDPGLRLSEGFGGRLLNSATAGRDAGRGIIGGTRSTLEGVGEGLEMTPEAYARISNVDEGAIEGMAGRATGSANTRILQAIQRQAAASGGGDPLAVAYALREMGDRGAEATGRAMADARVMAGREGRSAMATAEDMRLGAAGRRAGLTSQNQLALMGAGLDNEARGADAATRALQTGEGMRVDTARDIGDRQFRAAATSGSAALDTAQANANREMTAEDRIAGRDLDSETGMSNAYLGWRDNANNYFTDASRASEAANAARQAAIATNRQATTAGNQATGFEQGMSVSDRLSNAWNNISGARRQDEAEGRGYQTGQSNFFAQQAQRGAGQQIDALGTGAGATNNSMQIAQTASQAPKWWERVGSLAIGAAGALTGMGALGGAAGGAGGGGLMGRLFSRSAAPAAGGGGGFTRTPDFTGGRRLFGQGGVVTGPTNALLGEDGPEMVVPMEPWRQMVPEVSMGMLERVAPTPMLAMAGPGIGGAEGAFERLRQNKMRAMNKPVAQLGPLG